MHEHGAPPSAGEVASGAVDRINGVGLKKIYSVGRATFVCSSKIKIVAVGIISIVGASVEAGNGAGSNIAVCVRAAECVSAIRVGMERGVSKILIGADVERVTPLELAASKRTKQTQHKLTMTAIE